MPPLNHIQSNFVSGEISPRLLGRSDLAKYFNAASSLTNFSVMKHGGLIRRSGTRYVANQKDQTKVARVVGHRVGLQSYILEFGNATLRFYRASGQLNVAGTPTEIATPYADTDLLYLNFKVLQATDQLLICHPNYTPRLLTLDTTASDAVSGSWVLSLFRFIDGPYVDVNTSATTMLPSALTGNGVTLTASAATFFTGDAATATAAGRQFRVRHDYMDGEVNITGATKANPCVITAPNHGFADKDRIYIEGVKGMTQLNGKHYRVHAVNASSFSLDDDHQDPIDSSGYGTYTSAGYIAAYPITRLHGWGIFETTTYSSSTVLNGNIIADFKRQEASDVWMGGAWSERQGWPGHSEYHSNRLWFSRTTRERSAFWASKDTSITSFSPSNRSDDTITASAGMRFILPDVDSIYHLVSSPHGLVVLTTNGPRSLVSGDPNEPVSPISFLVNKHGTDGSSRRVPPIPTGGNVIFVSESNLVVRDLSFKFDDNQFVSPDLTIFSEHITLGGLIDSCYQQEPNNCLWFVRADGQIVCCTYERAEEVVAWHRHIVGGTSVVVESIACIREGTVDQIWMTVKRTINGSTKRYVEVLQPQFGIDTALSAGYFSDSHVTGSVSGATSASGLTHLEGQTVAVQINGAVGSTAVVSSGAITIPLTTGIVTAGLPFTSDLVGVPLVLSRSEDSRGRLARPFRVDTILHNTVGGTVSADNGSHYDLITYPDSTAGALFTGIRDIAVSDPSQLQPFIRVRQSDPLPMTLLSAITWMSVDGY